MMCIGGLAPAVDDGVGDVLERYAEGADDDSRKDVHAVPSDQLVGEMFRRSSSADATSREGPARQGWLQERT